MNGRNVLWMTLLALGALAVLGAMSAMADPPNINNAPTEDWFFDSGNNVTITGKTWNFNYNVTVANLTHLTFDNCDFSIGDPDDIYSRWMHVWWNGTMTIKDCNFAGFGAVRYYLVFENDTKIVGSTIEDTLAPSTYMGGLTVMDSDITLMNVTFKDSTGGYGIYVEDGELMADHLTVTDCGAQGSWSPAVYLEADDMNDWMDTFHVTMESCTIDRNQGVGLRIDLDDHRPATRINLWNTTLNDNDATGSEIYLYDCENNTMVVDLNHLEIMGNRYAGMYFGCGYLMYDGTGSLDLRMDSVKVEDNGEGGIYTDFYGFDGTIDVDMDDCVFKNNGVNTQWAFGGYYLYASRGQGNLDLMMDSTTFENNAQDGLRIRARSLMTEGNEVNITDCTFKENRDSGVYLDLDSYSDYPYFHDYTFKDSEFSDNPEAGLYVYHADLWETSYALMVEGCQFTGGGVFSDSYRYGDDSQGVSWMFDGCSFDDIDDYAIRLFLTRVMAGTTLSVRDCDVNDTNGIQYRVMDSHSDVQADHNLEVVNTDILRTGDSALDAHVMGYYGTELYATFENVEVDTSLYNGLKATASTNFGSTAQSIEMDYVLKDVEVVAVEGNGINLGSERIEYPGTRTVDFNGVTVNDTFKAVTLSGLKGEFRDTTLTLSETQDLIAITSNVELFQPSLDKLDATKVQVIESGSVKFWFYLKSKVMWDTGRLVDGAVLTVMDNHHTLIGIYTQTESDPVPDLMLNSFEFRETGLFTRSPYILNVTYKAIQKSTAVVLDQDRDVTVSLADHVPPSLFIDEPDMDHLQRSKTIDVRGSSLDTESGVEKVEVTIDGINWTTVPDPISWKQSFQVTDQDVIDSGGVFTIRARATDFAGNEASTYTRVEVDPFPPDLRIDHPYDGLETNQQQLGVRGVTEMGATVVVNGVDVPVAGTFFLAHVDLVEGPNTITISAFDALGNVYTEQMEVVLDTKPPYVVVLTPEEGELFTEPTCEVSGQAEEDLTLMVDGYVLGEEDYHDGMFSYDINLGRGLNTIVVEAVDMAGNHIAITRTVSLDDVAPMLAIQSPISDSHQSSKQITVVGTTDPDAYLLINDEMVELDHNLFVHTIVGIEGKNTITVSAQDGAGNEAMASIDVWVDPHAPVLVVENPPEEVHMVNSPDYTLSGTASEDAVKVNINGVDHEVDNGTWSVDLVLLEGTNQFIITLSDRAGNAVTSERSVVLDTVAPVLVVRIPDLREEDGVSIYKTEKGEPALMMIKGYTDDAVQVRINGEPVPISSDGYFAIEHSMNVNSVNTIEIVASDGAGNTRTWTKDITHEAFSPKEEEVFNWGYVILVLGLILLLIAIIAGWMRLSKAEPTAEPMELEEEEVLAPAAMPELEEEEEELEEEDEIVIEGDEEEVHELEPPSERPKTDTSRPAAAPSEEERGFTVSEKDLDEKEGETDIDADETDQEVV